MQRGVERWPDTNVDDVACRWQEHDQRFYNVRLEDYLSYQEPALDAWRWFKRTGVFLPDFARLVTLNTIRANGVIHSAGTTSVQLRQNACLVVEGEDDDHTIILFKTHNDVVKFKLVISNSGNGPYVSGSVVYSNLQEVFMAIITKEDMNTHEAEIGVRAVYEAYINEYHSDFLDHSTFFVRLNEAIVGFLSNNQTRVSRGYLERLADVVFTGDFAYDMNTRTIWVNSIFRHNTPEKKPVPATEATKRKQAVQRPRARTGREGTPCCPNEP